MEWISRLRKLRKFREIGVSSWHSQSFSHQGLITHLSMASVIILMERAMFLLGLLVSLPPHESKPAQARHIAQYVETHHLLNAANNTSCLSAYSFTAMRRGPSAASHRTGDCAYSTIITSSAFLSSGPVFSASLQLPLLNSVCETHIGEHTVGSLRGTKCWVRVLHGFMAMRVCCLS